MSLAVCEQRHAAIFAVADDGPVVRAAVEQIATDPPGGALVSPDCVEVVGGQRKAGNIPALVLPPSCHAVVAADPNIFAGPGEDAVYRSAQPCGADRLKLLAIEVKNQGGDQTAHSPGIVVARTPYGQQSTVDTEALESLCFSIKSIGDILADNHGPQTLNST